MSRVNPLGIFSLWFFLWFILRTLITNETLLRVLDHGSCGMLCCTLVYSLLMMMFLFVCYVLPASLTVCCSVAGVVSVASNRPYETKDRQLTP